MIQMKKFALVLRDEDDRNEIEKLILEHGFVKDEEKPDFVVCVGGDGTILVAERTYPSVPKLCFSKHTSCRTCQLSVEEMEKVLDALASGNFTVHEEMKLEARYGSLVKLALNEVQLHNEKPTHAIRFEVVIEEKGETKAFENVVGDGVIVATPFGSTAYYYSAGGEPFSKGVGIAFNNSHNFRIKPFVVDENATIHVKLLRGSAFMIVDNDEHYVHLDEGEEFVVRKAKERARFILIRGG